MPPRKSPNPATIGGGAAGATAAGASGATNNKDDGGRRKHAKLDPFPLTSEEKNFLAHVISLAGSTSPAALAKSKPSSATSGITSAGKQLIDDAWWTETAMPKLTAITEKVLKVAAEQYHSVYKDYVLTPENGGQLGDSSSIASGGNNASATLVPSGAAAQAAATNAPPPPPAGSPDQFAEENAYLVDQLRQLPQCPFTIERLAEILADPYQFHSSRDGKVKPEALQASLRRCILVTYPVMVSINNSADSVEAA